MSNNPFNYERTAEELSDIDNLEFVDGAGWRSKAKVQAERDKPKPAEKGADYTMNTKLIDTNEKTEWACQALGVRPDEITILNGYSCTGKTFFGVSMLFAVAYNTPVLGEIPINMSGNTLFISWEMNQRTMNLYSQRVRFGLGLPETPPNKMSGVYSPNFFLDDPIRPNTKTTEEQLAALIRKTGSKLCLIDSLIAGSPNTDMNDDRAGQIIHMLRLVSEKTNCAIIIIHHEAKQGGSDIRSVKGSSSIVGAAGGNIHLSYDEQTKVTELSLGKVRHTSPYKIAWTVQDCGNFVEHQGCHQGVKLQVVKNNAEYAKAQDPGDVIMQFVRTHPGCSSTDLSKGIEIGKSTGILVRNRLVDQGFLATAKVGKATTYSLTEAGEAYFEEETK